MESLKRRVNDDTAALLEGTRKTLKIAEEQAWKEQEQKAEEERISIENVEWKPSP